MNPLQLLFAQGQPQATQAQCLCTGTHDHAPSPKEVARVVELPQTALQQQWCDVHAKTLCQATPHGAHTYDGKVVGLVAREPIPETTRRHCSEHLFVFNPARI
jgi:hypothetical protein